MALTPKRDLRLNRRELLGKSARAGMGAAALALAGCAATATAREMGMPDVESARDALVRGEFGPAGDGPAGLRSLRNPQQPLPRQDEDQQDDQEQGDQQGDGEQQAPPMPASTMDEIAPGVYHYWHFASNFSSMVVISGDDVLVTDPASRFRVPDLQARIAEITDNPINKIVLTHEHYDHAGATWMLPDATLIVQRNALPVFELMELEDKPVVHCTFDDYLRVTAGDVNVDLHYLGPGDGDATTVVWLPNERILQTADMYEPKALTGADWVDDKNFAGTRKILQEISKWDASYAINAHSPGDSRDALAENVEYYDDLFDAVMAKIREAQAASPFAIFGLLGTIRTDVSLPKYAEWMNYEAALGEHAFRMFMSIFHGD